MVHSRPWQRGGRRRRLLVVAASLVISGLCIWLALRDVDLRPLGRFLADASPHLIVLAGLLALAMNAVKCTKLGVLLSSKHRIRYRSLFSAEMVSVLVDVIFPFRLIELVKAYIVGKSEGIRPSLVFGVEIVEKSVEVLFLLVVVFVLGLTHPLPGFLATGRWVGLGAVGLAARVFAVAVVRPALLERPVGWIGGLPQPGARWIGGVLSQIVGGVRVAAVRPTSLGLVMLITLVEWGFLSASLWASAAAVRVPIGPGELLGMLVANHLAFAMVSSSMSSVGIYEYAGKTTLVVLFDMAPERALGLVIVFHAVQVGFGALGGFIGLALARLSLREIREQAGAASSGRGKDDSPDA
jgi:hypothetical protein